MFKTLSHFELIFVPDRSKSLPWARVREDDSSVEVCAGVPVLWAALSRAAVDGM